MVARKSRKNLSTESFAKQGADISCRRICPSFGCKRGHYQGYIVNQTAIIQDYIDKTC